MLTGQSNWDKSVIEGNVPHDTDVSAPIKKIEKNKDSSTIAATEQKEGSVAYERWNPELKDKKD